MTSQAMGVEDLKVFYQEVFAPMILQMQIEPVEILADGAAFLVPTSEFIMRSGGIVCGQAVASICDTVGVMALMAHNETRRMMTTVDMTTHFQRPLFDGQLDVRASLLSNGRRMATVRIDVRQAGSEKIAASSTVAYAYVD